MTQPSLDLITQWARAAGAILLEGFGRDHTLTYKDRNNLQTEMDRRSEAFLLEQVRAAFPDHRVLAEESGLTEGLMEHYWLIDPLDGTTNYAHGFPMFSVSIAYAFQGAVQLGVVYDPVHDECYSAERGKGAWLNGEPIRVSTTDQLINALLVTGFPYQITKPENQKFFTYFQRFATRAQSVRRLGSAALDACYVAAGRIDGYWQGGVGAWDLAAGALIASEAGATITRLNGSPDYMAPPYNTVITNPTLHMQMLAVLAEPLD